MLSLMVDERNKIFKTGHDGVEVLIGDAFGPRVTKWLVRRVRVYYVRSL